MEKNKKAIFGWTMYDWANSAFATTIMAAVLPVYYSNVAAKGLDKVVATSYWAYTQTIAMLIVAVLAPILGVIADVSNSKRRFLFTFAGLGIISSLALALVGEGDYLLASILMVLGSIGFAGGNVFYDAFLPSVAPPGKMDAVSTKGYAMGYIGGGLLLLINLLMIMKYQWFGLPNQQVATQLSFASVGIWWFLFAIPIFRHVQEEPNENIDRTRDTPALTFAFSRVIQTFKEIRKFKQLFIFLLAFWLFNDGIATIIRMASAYGSSIGIGGNDLIAALLITQVIGIPCSFLFGWLAQRISAKHALYIALWVYVLIVALGFFMTSALHFYILAALVGLVQGGAQALSRSIYGSMIPKGRYTEFFGFFGISSKFSAIFGPFLFGYVGVLMGDTRYGIIPVFIFILLGMILLAFVDVEKGRQDASNEEALSTTSTSSSLQL
ncbi:MFS transporter [Rubeoparvulum massiliense]|uniref:MFS transporter n=1 Tax=Rubeoparvulum massiliense TaxID=1631346 RepID=UPI00065E2346|nr:MFS transporter [Rubeoparvulum massiliense]